MIICYVTCKNKKQANKISNSVIKEKLAACANIFPVESMYQWKGKICHVKETVLILKTTARLWKQLKLRVNALHDYELPCIIKINAKANAPFEQWIQYQTK